MECTIIPEQLRVFLNALEILCKCGDYTQINIKKSGIELSTLNDAESEFLQIKFKESFFDSYKIRRRPREERAVETDSFFLPQTKLFKLIFTKLSIVETVEWSIAFKNQDWKMVVKFLCKHSVEKEWTMNVEKREVKQAIGYQDKCYAYFSADPMLMIQSLGVLHSKNVKVSKRSDGLSFVTADIAHREEIYAVVSIDFVSLLQYSFSYANVQKDIELDNSDLLDEEVERFRKFVQNPKLYAIRQSRRRRKKRNGMSDEDDEDDEEEDDEDGSLQTSEESTSAISQSEQSKKMKEMYCDKIAPPIPMETNVAIGRVKSYFQFCHKCKFALDFLIKDGNNPLVLLSNNTSGMNDVDSMFVVCAVPGYAEESEDEDDGMRNRKKNQVSSSSTTTNTSQRGDLSQRSDSSTTRISSYSSAPSSSGPSSSGPSMDISQDRRRRRNNVNNKTGSKRKRKKRGEGENDDEEEEVEGEGDTDDDDDDHDHDVMKDDDVVDDDRRRRRRSDQEPRRKKKKLNPEGEGLEDEEEEEEGLEFEGRPRGHFYRRNMDNNNNNNNNNNNFGGYNNNNGPPPPQQQPNFGGPPPPPNQGRGGGVGVGHHVSLPPQQQQQQQRSNNFQQQQQQMQGRYNNNGRDQQQQQQQLQQPPPRRRQNGNNNGGQFGRQPQQQQQQQQQNSSVVRPPPSHRGGGGNYHHHHHQNRNNNNYGRN